MRHPMKRLFLLAACLLGVASLRADILTDRPAKIESVDPKRGVATFTVAAHNGKSTGTLYPGQIADIHVASVMRLEPNFRRQKATLDDLRPGMNVLLTGVLSISSQLVTEIKIDEHSTSKQH